MGESVIFQPVLQAYPTCHSWILTVHVSLGHLECHWKAFNRQLARTQLLRFLDQQPSAPTQLLSTLEVELTNTEDIYNSCKPTIISAINLLQTNPSFDGQSQSHIHHKKSLLPFLGDALRWITGTATTKDINNIKTWINKSIMTQSSQQETLVHVISILNVTRYAAQVSRHSINILMDMAEATSHNINNLYNLTKSLATSISFQQLILHIRSVFANLVIHSTTSKWFLHIPWITSMQPHQEYYLDTSYLSWIYKRCCYTYQTPYHLHCTCLFHQRIPYILQIFMYTCSD